MKYDCPQVTQWEKLRNVFIFWLKCVRKQPLMAFFNEIGCTSENQPELEITFIFQVIFLILKSFFTCVAFKHFSTYLLTTKRATNEFLWTSYVILMTYNSSKVMYSVIKRGNRALRKILAPTCRGKLSSNNQLSFNSSSSNLYWPSTEQIFSFSAFQRLILHNMKVRVKNDSSWLI